jgi:hypothetical protein
MNSLKQDKTILGTFSGLIVEILSFNLKKDSYKVRFDVEGGDDYIDIISVKELRANKPLEMSQLQIENFEKQK